MGHADKKDRLLQMYLPLNVTMFSEVLQRAQNDGHYADGNIVGGLTEQHFRENACDKRREVTTNKMCGVCTKRTKI
jgi:hypothetical protein